ncbi:MAG: N-acetyl-gamma-glutamyl-phosphate reductase [Candidatus Hydrogenedentota bacterium]|nr:MAG: N-acetyl-gamma-glutamyl-phosphate reductase [Candidatus Hydrogenedentota bacterium]
MIQIGIIGAAGFTGKELLKILSYHPEAKVVCATSSVYAGQKISEVFPEFYGTKIQEMIFIDHPKESKDLKGLDIIFTATPDKVSMQFAYLADQANVKMIDIAGAFRLSAEDFEENYSIQHTAKDFLAEAVYGLPEKNRGKIKDANLVANPGCYPTAMILPFIAGESVLKNVQIQQVIAEGKSGTSGAGGRSEKDSLTFSTVNENFRAYKVKRHQHEVEMQSHLPVKAPVRFTPYLLPLFRGILLTSYVVAEHFPESVEKKLQEGMKEFADREPFIVYEPDPNKIEIRNVVRTNFAHLSFYFDKKHHLLIFFSVIDNLLKGAAGNAVQNFNLVYGLPETLALVPDV